jgi:hypothetical protein
MVKTTIEQLYRMRDAFVALESGDRIERGANGTRITREPFLLGALRLEIAKNLNRATAEINIFEEARGKLIRELTNGKDSISKDSVEPDVWARWLDEIDKMGKTEVDVDLLPLPKDRLNLDKNEIPIQALAALDELIQ